MFTYRGTADCVLSDGTSMPVLARLTSGSGALDSISGIATSPDFPLPYRTETEVTLRLPDRRARKFLIENVVGTTELRLVSNGDWLP